jgi:predicted naringenin-chalcone synthase
MSAQMMSSWASVGFFGNLIALCVVFVLWAATTPPPERIPPREKW